MDFRPDTGGLFGDSDVPQPPLMVYSLEGLQKCIQAAN